MTLQETFVTRLRRHRERQQISLDAIAATTRIKRELLEALERNDLTDWPRGVYARAWMRAYASVVGLDPMDTVSEFCRIFPHGDRRAGGTLQEMAAIVAHPSQYRDEFSHGLERRRTLEGGVACRINMLRRPAWHVALTRPLHALWLRLTLRPSPVRLKRTPRMSA
ncbi:MAG: helix-turn-helix domain-containing protein [Acidobacteria bacterium]|nr:helix-turn-helix domain-containing protein [Acidobacteriota bacterium]